MSGAPLDGGHAARVDGVASAVGVEVACRNRVEDAEKNAINEVMEGEEARALELEDAEAKVFLRSLTMGLPRAMWRSLCLALRARSRRVVPPAHPQPP